MEWPPLSYGSEPPLAELGVHSWEVATRVQRSRDCCIVDMQHYFLRGNIEIPIIGHADRFIWSAWCSVSEKSFETIAQLADMHEQIKHPPFFAWLLTRLPCYSEPTAPVKAQLHLRGPCVIPYIEVWPEHPLGKEQLTGIAMERVTEFARAIIGDGPRPTQHWDCYSPE